MIVREINNKYKNYTRISIKCHFNFYYHEEGAN
jgi:hypothetical protein